MAPKAIEILKSPIYKKYAPQKKLTTTADKKPVTASQQQDIPKQG